MVLTSAERQRKRWASMTDEERAAYYERRKAKPSRQTLARVPEWKRKFGDGWLPVHERPFMGVDGEGGTWEGRHCYGMLTVGETTLQNEDGSPLSSIQCLNFLTAQPKKWRYVIYFGGYDATLILRDLPVDVQAEIMAGSVGRDGKRTYTWWDDYGIDYIPRKLLKIVRKKSHPDGPGSITLYDVSAYWQCSFLKALQDWGVGTEEEWEEIRVGKESRSEFTLPAPPEVLKYNLLECRLLAALVTKMVEAAETLGITLRSYHGPAVLAEALMDKNDVGIYMYVRQEGGVRGVRSDEGTSDRPQPQDWEDSGDALSVLQRVNGDGGQGGMGGGPSLRSTAGHRAQLQTTQASSSSGEGEPLECRETSGTLQRRPHLSSPHPRNQQTIPAEVEDLFRFCYYGGRFECSAVGIAPEVYELDIASAYPHAMVTLPCQVCGEWRKGRAENAQASINRVSWALPEGTRWCPFPWRDKSGALCYPRIGTGWYWGDEVKVAVALFGDSVIIEETWSYRTDCTHQPFAWVVEVYEERKKLGKNAAGRVYKLALNSSYGVLARTVGGGGRYSNAWWAGQITARTRGRLLEVAHAGGDDCLMLATDGAYFSRRQFVPTGNALGDWEDGGQVGPLILIQPGVYLSLSPEGKKYRTRGVSLKSIEKLDGVRRLVEAWRADGPEAVVPMNVGFLLSGEDEPMVFVGTKLALAWGKPELIGSWQTLSKSLSFRPEPRRQRAEWEGELLRTVSPLHPFAALGVPSAPYKKMTRNEEVEAMREVQPWLPMGL